MPVIFNPSEYLASSMTDKIRQALNRSDVVELFIPRNEDPDYYMIEDTIVVPAGKGIVGEGQVDALCPETDPLTGTLIKTSGSGTARVWTDINGIVSDAAITPAFVAGGRGAYLRNISIMAGSTPWDVGFFVPAVRKVKMLNVSILGSWASAGLYLDATWGHLNTIFTDALNATLPDTEDAPYTPVVPDNGMCEFEAISCYFRGHRSFVLQGTDRDPDGYAPTVSANPWLWSPAGTSDLRFIDCDFRPSDPGSNSACVWLDAASNNNAEAGQGIWMFGSALRTASAKYMLYADRINRVYIQGYGETNTDVLNPLDPAGMVSLTSRTGPIELDGRFEGAYIFSDFTYTGAQVDNGNAALENLIVKNYDGRQYVHNMVYGKLGPVPLVTSGCSLGTSSRSFDTAFTKEVRSDTDLKLRGDGSIQIAPSSSVNKWSISDSSIAPSVNNTHSLGTSSLNLANVRTAQVQSDDSELKLRSENSITFAIGGSTIDWTLTDGGLQSAGSEMKLQAAGTIAFAPATSSTAWAMSATSIVPAADGTQSLGTSTYELGSLRTRQVRTDAAEMTIRGQTSVDFCVGGSTVRWAMVSNKFSPGVTNSSDIGDTDHRIRRTYTQFISATGLPIYADNAAATTGGIATGEFYRTSAGAVMVRY